MRDYVLAAIVVVISLVGIGMPRLALYGYVWFSLLRPDILAFSPVGRPYSKMLAASVLVGSLRFLPGYFRLFSNPFLVVYAMLQVVYLMSVYAAVDQDMSLNEYYPFLNMSLVLAVMPLLIQTMRDMKWLVLIFAVSLGLLGAKFGLFAVLAGGARYMQGYGGAIADNNVAALALACAVPFIWYGQDFVSSRLVKLGYAIVAGLTAVGVIMFHSRGGLLTLAVILMFIVWRSQRRIFAVIMVALSVVPAAMLVWETLSTRVDKLINYEEDISAVGRLVYWKAALRISLDYPFFGTGFGGGNSVVKMQSYLPPVLEYKGHFVHNTYLQVLVDCGYPALLLYCTLLFGSIWWLWRYSSSPESAEGGRRQAAWALQASLIGFAVGCTFLSRVLFDFSYMLFLATASLYAISKQSMASAVVTPVAAQPAMAPTLAATAGPAVREESQQQPEWRQMTARERREVLRQAGPQE